jgi:REase_DpnII-MboI
MDKLVDKLLSEGTGYTFSNNSFRQDEQVWTRTTDLYQAWLTRVEDFILETYGENSPPFRQFKRFNINDVEGYGQNAFDSQHAIIIGALKACQSIEPKKKIVPITKEMILDNLFERFHSIAIQLRNRHSARETLDVRDEYDVQDLLHALLKLNFNDIRKEEWTPSYAGGSSRMDFLLKSERIVIEVKKTRAGLDDKELGKQLIEDKAKYQVHPDCRKLICFTYDPDGRIVNPKGLQNDLNHESEDFKVVIVIKPEH